MNDNRPSVRVGTLPLPAPPIPTNRANARLVGALLARGYPLRREADYAVTPCPRGCGGDATILVPPSLGDESIWCNRCDDDAAVASALHDRARAPYCPRTAEPHHVRQHCPDCQAAEQWARRAGRKVAHDLEHGTTASAPLYGDVAALLAEGIPEPPVPSIGRRADEVGLFYAGQVNTIFGDPESGKTWVALAAVAEALDDGGSAMVVDLDHNGIGPTVSRLLALGVPKAVLADPARFRYAEPDDEAAIEQLTADAADWTPAVVVVDSMGELLPIFGASSNDADDFTRVHQRALKPFALLGAAVIVIDHLAKAGASRDYGAGGTVAKRRATGGTSLRCTVARAFKPGHGGIAELFIHKDRHGGLRAASPGADREPLAARFELIAEEGEGVAWQLHAPDPASAPTTLDYGEKMQAVRDLLADLGVDVQIGQRKAYKAVKDAHDAGKDVPAWITQRMVWDAQAERRTLANIIVGDPPTGASEGGE